VEAKRRLGVVPQNPGLYRDLTVSEYLSLVQRLYGRGSPEGTIEAYGLADYRHRPLATLSGGYARRLLVAAAVLSEPELLLLDEPTVGLDPLAADDVRGLIGAAAEGRTVLMSTHNMYEAEALCDSVIILRDGRVLVHERIERLRRQTRPRVYIAATGPVERLGLALGDLRIPWEREAGTVEEPGVWADIADPEASMPDLLRALLSSGVDVYECRLAPPTLHDLFVRAVRDE
jgi:ABC-2 type transport system ATP-binding protein